MGEKAVRKLEVRFDKGRLYRSIDLCFRRRRLQRILLGTDYLQGVLINLLRHPETTLEEAIANAVSASSLPGSHEDFSSGVEYIAEALETIIPLSADNVSLDMKPEEEQLEIIGKMVDEMRYEVYKEYCYSKTLEIIGIHHGATFEEEILKNMLFKKLVADDSTAECMYEYTARKLELDNNPEEIERLAKSAIPDGKTLIEYVNSLADKAYEI